jgi:preprotein translocase subunit SecD
MEKTEKTEKVKVNLYSFFKKKIIILIILITLFCLGLIIFKGINFGIEFAGGTRIPIVLEKSVDKETMNEIVNNIKIRATKFGLAQVAVKSVGDRQIYVEIPTTDPKLVEEIEKIVKAEGKFEAIIDKKVALTGKDIISGSIREDPQVYGGDIRWAVDFIITKEGSEAFGAAAYGKGNYPVHLFLDRIENSIIIVKKSYLQNENFTQEEIKEMIEDILNFSNNEIMYEEEFDLNKIIEKNKTVIISSSSEKLKNLKELNISLVEKNEEELIPKYSKGKIKNFVDEWSAIGLLSSPTLSENLATGKVGQMFRIEGSSVGKTQEEKREYAINQMKKIKSILSGGAIPVKLSLGSITTIPPSLGKDFLTYSIVGLIIAYILVMIITLARYKRPEFLFVLILIPICQLVILVGINGTVGTIDLASIAGLFATIGTSVDAQIVVSDEILKTYTKDEMKRKSKKAFYIITRDAAVLIIMILPLLFSNIVEVIGFVNVLLIGTVLNILITLQMYSAAIDSIEGP